MKNKSEIFTSTNPEETMDFGTRLGKGLKPGAFIALTGELGAGKTIFAKGIARGLGVKQYGYVNSPSFVILREYMDGKLPLYHFDVYRLGSSKDLDTVGYEDYFYGRGVTVVEWADKITDILPAERLDIRIDYAGKNKRKLTLSGVKAR
ncbi:MAG: tRNA (adenosine(37)-N6)-threonylcarbamoyltransferase complex ATPase subunit type 1 TsaE [Candidatus Omnitrophota bacterium]